MPSAIRIFSKAIELYKSRFVSLIILSALVFVFSYFNEFLSSRFLFLVVPFTIINLIILTFISIALLLVLSENIGVIEAFKRSRSKFINFFIVSLLVGLVVYGGLFMLFIPGIIFIIWFGFSAIVAVLEGDRGFDALLKSKAYVAGKWWTIFWYFVFIGIVVIVPLMYLGAIYEYLSATRALLTSIGVLYAILSILVFPVFPAYMFSIYLSLKNAKPELVNQKPGGSKGFFVFSAVLGIVVITGMLAWVQFSDKKIEKPFGLDFLKNENFDVEGNNIEVEQLRLFLEELKKQQ